LNILCSLLFILLIWSTSGFAEPLALIEEKLTIRIYGVENTEGLDVEKISTKQDNPIVDIPPVQSNAKLQFDFQNRTHTDENFSYPFSVQLGSSRSLKLCYRVSKMLRTLGYPAFNSSIELKNRGLWHRVYIGSFTTRDAAQKIKDQLLAETIGEGFLRHLEFAVQVGTSGTADQLTPLNDKLLSSSYLPYSTSIRNASSGAIEGRLLIGACYQREDCNLLLTTIVDEGFSAVIVER